MISALDEVKLNIRESDFPMFADAEIQQYLELNNNDVAATSHQLLILKSQDTSLQVSGLSCGDSSKFFLRLAEQYRPIHSGVLKGGW